MGTICDGYVSCKLDKSLASAANFNFVLDRSDELYNRLEDVINTQMGFKFLMSIGRTAIFSELDKSFGIRGIARGSEPAWEFSNLNGGILIANMVFSMIYGPLNSLFFTAGAVVYKGSDENYLLLGSGVRAHPSQSVNNLFWIKISRDGNEAHS
jgi:hypothetical protein